MEFKKKKNIFCPILLIWYRDINRELDIFFSSNFTFRKRLRKKIDTCILCMIQHLMISDEVHRYLPVYCYFLISSILIEFPCNLQINTYQGSNLFMSICTKSHPRKDLQFSCFLALYFFFFYILFNLTFKNTVHICEK